MRQCLNRLIDNLNTMKEEFRALQRYRNNKMQNLIGLTTFIMIRKVFVIFVLCSFLISCVSSKKTINSGNSRDEFIRVSTTNPRYFETTNGHPWIPLMINFIIPNGEETEVFKKIETYFKHFSENGGNAMRIWISSPFLEIEDKKVGEYNPAKFNRIDSMLSLAKKYGILIKFTLQHIRSIEPASKRKSGWSNRDYMSVENGGSFKSINEYINTPMGKTAYLNRVKTLAERYKENKQIFSWELWNEMDAVDGDDWFSFTVEMLDSVKALLPNHLIAQTLGSMHSPEADKRYEKLLAIKN